jgi:hypothetical protein
MNELKTCTKEHPYKEGDAGRWQHPDAELLFEDYNGLAGGGDWERYRCPHCGKLFWVELPD